MKLRIKGNSLRLRLLRSDVERLKAAGAVSEETRFGTRPDQTLKYSLIATDGVDEVSVEYSDSQILVMLPETAAMNWTTTDELSIKASIDIGNDDLLELLIEKDLECIGRPDDPDRDDAFPNPNA